MATRLLRLLRDDTPIGYAEIADMLGVSIETVKRWRPGSSSRLKTRLPEPDCPPRSRHGGGPPAPRWRTATIAAWAINPDATGSGLTYLHPSTGRPITQRGINP